MHHRKGTFRAALVLLLLVAACGGGGGEGAEGGDGGEPTSEAAASATSEPAASSDGGGPTTSEPERRETVALNVGYIDTSINGAAIIAIANDQDLWAQAGIEANIIPFTNGPQQIEAMTSGDVEVGYIGGGATWLPASGRATIIAPNEATFGDYVLARPESGIAEPGDLEGKRVAVPEGTSGDLILSLALESAGLEQDAVERVFLDPPNAVTAFVGGQVDAAAIFSPLADQIRTSVPDTVVVANNRDYPDTTFLGAWVAANETVEQRPDVVARFLEVFIAANDYRRENPEEAVELTSALSGAPVEQLQGQVNQLEWFDSDQILADNADGTTFERLNSIQELFVTVDRLDDVTDPAEFVNTELFAQAKEATS